MSYVFTPPAVPSVPVVDRSERFPIHRIYCVGRNYEEHAKEMGFTGREPPFFFIKPADTAVVIASGETGSMDYPTLTSKSEGEIDAFKKELYKFEHGLPYNSSAVEYRYTQVMRSFFEKNFSERPVYVSPEIELEYSQGFERIPSGLVFRLSKGKEYVPLAETGYSYRVPVRGGTYVDGILSFYAQSYLNYGIYANLYGMKEEAKKYVEKALVVKPAYEQALAWKARLNQP